ncbi:MAG: trigger factor [Deltaproteobacteria bacterium]|nr:trigger factor [Deltaproteobacteria bacterium]
MHIEHELLSPTRCRVHLTIPAEAVDAAFRTALAQITQRAQIKGFRPGKAPPAVIERLFSSDLRSRVLDQLLRTHVPQAVAQVDVRKVTAPEVDRLSELQKGEPLQVWVLFEVQPKLALSGYRGAPLSSVVVVADQADVEAELERMRQERAELAPVDSSVQDGDTTELTYTVTDTATGDAIEAQQNLQTTYELRRLSATVYSAFAGAKAGDTVDLTLPAEGGTDATVRVQGTLVSVSRPAIPAVDDELAVDLGFADLAAARAHIAERLASRAQALTAETRERIAIDHMLATNEVPVPSTLVAREVEDQIRNLRQQFAQLGGAMDGFFDNYRAILAAETRKSLARSLALHHIVEVEAVAADAQAVQASIEARIARSPKLAREIRRATATPQGLKEAEFVARMDAARALLVEVAQWSVSETLSLAGFEAWNARREASDRASGDAEPADGEAADRDQAHPPAAIAV